MSMPSSPDSRDALLRRERQPSLSSPDAALAGLVIGIVGLMIVPLPTWLLDLLISSNMALAITILLVTLYITEPLKIAAFPSILLLTTLVRLALNVSSTRLILLQADAGAMISAFGDFVVRGNYVVGGVIFLILSIIQFVVIAKGSERVAEVGARFALDAMPGKQMAIDAELRAGGIDGAEAKRQRRKLARESQFYGAMDGAMKFVKGDVIASFLITGINLLGGLAIGVFQRDMNASDALKRYGLLTIGDGLVSQIPALILATAAGILVTRVASEEDEHALGKELTQQLLRTPKALFVAAVFIVGLALTPGLPFFPLITIGGLLFMVSRRPAPRAETSEESAVELARDMSSSVRRARFVPVVVPWSLEMAADLEPWLDDAETHDELVRPGLRSVPNAIREVLFRDLGTPLPACVIRTNPALPSRAVVLSLFEVPVQTITLAPETAPEDLAVTLMDRLMATLRRRATDFIGIAETQMLLDRLEHIAPATVRQVTPKPVSVGLLSDVLRRLVEEQVNIRNLKAILEALAQVAQNDRDPLNLTEFVRSQLRRELTHQATMGAGTLPVLLLEPELEDAVRGAISRTSGGAFLTLSPPQARDVVTAVRRALQSAEDQQAPARVLLTQADVRRFVRRLLETDFPHLPVLSYGELLPEVHLQRVAMASLRGL